MNHEITPPLPVGGIVFGRSISKTIGFLVLNIVFLIMGVCMIWAKLTGQVLDRGANPEVVNWWGLLIGIGAVIFAPLTIMQMIRSLWVKRRIVIGQDRIQMVELHNSQDVVILQIPFANIAEAKYEATSSERRVGITLQHLDEDTYALHEKFETNLKTKGRHYCITSGYVGGPRAIATAIDRAFSLWNTKKII
jgi:hypothetical protein